MGVDILDGTLRVGTPLCVVKVDPVTQKKEIIPLGKMYVPHFAAFPLGVPLRGLYTETLGIHSL